MNKAKQDTAAAFVLGILVGIVLITALWVVTTDNSFVMFGNEMECHNMPIMGRTCTVD